VIYSVQLDDVHHLILEDSTQQLQFVIIIVESLIIVKE